MTFECIVVGSHLRFDGVWQRPHHIAGRLGRRVPVLFVEEPFYGPRDSDEIRSSRGASVLRPVRREPGGAADPQTLRAVGAWVGARRPLVWLYTPMMSALADVAADGMVVYDCMDELAAFAFAPPELAAREAELLPRARLVFTGGASLYASRRSLGAKVRLFPSGVEFEHFARARSLPRPDVFAHLTPPVCGYVGVVDERIDVDVVAALAERDVQVAFVGPVVKVDPGIFPRRPNVHLLGQMPYADLPALLAGFDVAIMPFARNDATAFISPTKTPEYLAAGRPVVSTPVADVVAAYGDVVTFAASPDEFAQACLAVRPDAARTERGAERARDAGWDAIVERMWSDLEHE